MPSNLSASVELEIPFHDVDSYRIVWHGHYAKYFELARCKLLCQLEIGYNQLEAIGFFYPVVDLQAKYVQPLHFEQWVVIQAKLTEWQHRLVIHYRIHDRDSGKLTTKGKTTQVAVSPNGKLLFDTPQPVLDTIEANI